MHELPIIFIAVEGEYWHAVGQLVTETPHTVVNYQHSFDIPVLDDPEVLYGSALEKTTYCCGCCSGLCGAEKRSTASSDRVSSLPLSRTLCSRK